MQPKIAPDEAGEMVQARLEDIQDSESGTGSALAEVLAGTDNDRLISRDEDGRRVDAE